MPSDLTSKELLRRTGLSRATLNNYIALGLLPRPQVAPPGPGEGRARRLGYFPASALERIEEINRLKATGLSMAQIAAQIGTQAPSPPAAPARSTAMPTASATTSPRLTLVDLSDPAYRVNANLEVEWANAAAIATLFGRPSGLPGPLAERHILALLIAAGAVEPANPSGRELIAAHLAVAKHRLPRAALARLEPAVGRAALAAVEQAYDAAEPAAGRPALRRRLTVQGRVTDLYLSFFREGTLFVHAPASADGGGIADLLASRDRVVQELLRRRNPFYTPLAALAAELQDADRLCTELPAEDFFALLDLTWSAADATLRRYHAAAGGRRGAWSVQYFLPQPDAGYLVAALGCADELQGAMREVRAQWLRRSTWREELTLNIGLASGTEWLGTVQPGDGALLALGPTTRRARCLAQAGRGGQVLATKELIAALPDQDRARVRFGVHRAGTDGRLRLQPGRFARLDEFAAQPPGGAGALAVTEIVGPPAPAADRA